MNIAKRRIRNGLASMLVGTLASCATAPKMPLDTPLPPTRQTLEDATKGLPPRPSLVSIEGVRMQNEAEDYTAFWVKEGNRSLALYDVDGDSRCDWVVRLTNQGTLEAISPHAHHELMFSMESIRQLAYESVTKYRSGVTQEQEAHAQKLYGSNIYEPFACEQCAQ